MFQITEAPGCYEGFLQPLKYTTKWSPDSNILSSMDVETFMTWKDTCMECGTPKRSGVGMFCSNFLSLIKPLPRCYAVWCRECYHTHPKDTFWVHARLAKGYEKSEDPEKEEHLNKRFRIARDGYHLMVIPFECYLCQFRNVNERYPIHGNARDKYTKLWIRRAIMGYFWIRDTSTVSVNFRRLRQDYSDSIKILSIRRPLPIIVTN